MNELIRFDLYKFQGFDVCEGTPVFHLWRKGITWAEVRQESGMVQLKNRLHELYSGKGIFITPEVILIPTGKIPEIC